MNHYFLLLAFLLTFASASAQSSFRSDETVNHLPAVFQLGNYSGPYNNLVETEPKLLLSVCDNDLGVAFEKWYLFLNDIQRHASRINFDIRGVKMWVNVFFNKDGSIKHIAYHLKPKSRNIDTKKLDAFFTSFVTKSKIKVSSDQPFYHSGHAAFPVSAHP